jgi:hypothetical protein
LPWVGRSPAGWQFIHRGLVSTLDISEKSARERAFWSGMLSNAAGGRSSAVWACDVSPAIPTRATANAPRVHARVPRMCAFLRPMYGVNRATGQKFRRGPAAAWNFQGVGAFALPNADSLVCGGLGSVLRNVFSGTECRRCLRASLGIYSGMSRARRVPGFRLSCSSQ